MEKVIDILGAKAPAEMIELFCKNPDKEYYSKEVGEKIDLSKATTIKWLKRLTERGILSEKTDGRKKVYKLRWNNPLAREMRVLVTISELLSAFKNIGGLRAAYLVGSSAKGTDAPNTPVEILIMQRGDDRRIKKILDDVEDEIGREIEARIMTPFEYAELARDKPKVHERLEREKIRLTFS